MTLSDTLNHLGVLEVEPQLDVKVHGDDLALRQPKDEGQDEDNMDYSHGLHLQASGRTQFSHNGRGLVDCQSKAHEQDGTQYSLLRMSHMHVVMCASAQLQQRQFVRDGEQSLADDRLVGWLQKLQRSVVLRHMDWQLRRH